MHISCLLGVGGGETGFPGCGSAQASIKPVTDELTRNSARSLGWQARVGLILS